ncbi:MAG TPA: hypothetical protein VEK15_26405 [Vicinamibacteria bacterium]|nr:hypothetical protein [Vicinamibacteria bacterium]
MALWLVVAAMLGIGENVPELSLDGPRILNIKAGAAAQGARKRAEFRARLEGEISSPATYYCLAEEWDWDDGSFSLSEPDCDPYEPGDAVTRDFQESHYFGPGQYTITFRLLDGDEVVAKAVHELRVYGSAVLQ